MTYEEAYKLYTKTLDEIRTILRHHDLGVIPQGVAITEVERTVNELDGQLKIESEQAKGANNA